MLISLKSEYGLRALMDIAAEGKNRPVGRAGIARRQQIPLPYLTQVLGRLVNGGLLKSTRGPAGGYNLSRSPASISLLQVITALQGQVAPANCDSIRQGGQCGRLEGCGLAGVWSRLQSASERVLEKTSLMDILSENVSGKVSRPMRSHETAAAGAGRREGGKPSTHKRLDCIGDACPLPIVRIAKEIRELRPSQILEVWADDEGAKADIPAWCMGTGNDFLGHEAHGRQMKFMIRKAASEAGA